MINWGLFYIYRHLDLSNNNFNYEDSLKISESLI